MGLDFTLENFLNFIIRNNAPVIEGLIAVIAFLTVVSAVHFFLSEKASIEEEINEAQRLRSGEGSSLGESGDSRTGGPDPQQWAQLEDNIKKILEKTLGSQTSGLGSGGTGSGEISSTPHTTGASDPAVLQQITLLQKQLEEKNSEIQRVIAEKKELLDKARQSAELAKSSSGSTSSSSENSAQLEAQIKELKTKLSEYEIISEEIADLTTYKEENLQLKKQLETLHHQLSPDQTQQAPTLAPVPTQPQTPDPAPIQAQTPALAPVPGSPLASQTQQNPEAPAGSLEPSTVPVTTSTTNSAPAPVSPPEETGESPSVDLGQMDIDKMLSEASTLEDKGSDPSVAALPSILESELNPDRLIEEASSMDASDPLSPSETFPSSPPTTHLNPNANADPELIQQIEHEENINLMGKFEDYVKKGAA